MMQIGRKMVLRNVATGEVRHAQIDDYPGDCTVIFLEALVTEDGDISVVEEIDDPGDQRPLQVGWHLNDCSHGRWEIIEIEDWKGFDPGDGLTVEERKERGLPQLRRRRRS